MMLSRNSSVSRRSACRRLSSKSGNSCGVGVHPLQLLPQYVGMAQPALLRRLQQLVVGNAAPEKERETRGKIQVAQPIARARRQANGVVLEAEDELRARENPANAELDAGV